MVIKRILIMAFSSLLLCSCRHKIKLENRVLTMAKRDDKPTGAKNNLSSMGYYWKGKYYGDTNSFNALYSKQYDYFLIYVDKTNPDNWTSYSQEDYGYSDPSFIPDSLRKKLNIDNSDFKLLEQEY